MNQLNLITYHVIYLFLNIYIIFFFKKKRKKEKEEKIWGWPGEPRGWLPTTHWRWPNTGGGIDHPLGSMEAWRRTCRGSC
jgi:hypothetical protein